MKSPSRSLLLLFLLRPMAAAGFQLLMVSTTLCVVLLPSVGNAASVFSSPTQPFNSTEPGLAFLSGVVAASHVRRKRATSSKEMKVLLDYHNRVRSQVFPPAANMEYMLWDEGLAKSADSWASRCVWDHGPTQAMKYMGQNLSVTSGRYQSITDLVRSWYNERHRFSYPNKCSGSVCSHYTQMVWASSSRLGCAVRRCSNMHVFGSTWREATILVCNYAIKGNWVREAPYKRGKPCSLCPSTYGGSCWRNQCSPKPKHTKL